MPASRITTDQPDLTPLFGELDDEQRARIGEVLERSDHLMTEVHGELAAGEATWNTHGVVLSTEISGQASIDVLLEEATGKLTFEAQLRPRNFFPTEAEMWQPGRPPLQMATDGWDVDGAVSVRFRTRVSGRPYTIQEQVVELEERRYSSPVEAAEAFGELCERLAELARSREPTVEAWKPDAG